EETFEMLEADRLERLREKEEADSDFETSPEQLELEEKAAQLEADRLDLIKVAFLIGANNPILGVGISNYALHYKQYGYDKRFKRDFKVIPNNVYAEIFSETGVIGLFLFFYFLFLLLQQTSSDKTNVLKYGLIVSMVYLLAFPTYTVLFIWVFFGLITSQYKTRDSSLNELGKVLKIKLN
ncbi:MAG: O-antigen ligase family protein, partial [Bacteroidota bacterium]